MLDAAASTTRPDRTQRPVFPCGVPRRPHVAVDREASWRRGRRPGAALWRLVSRSIPPGADMRQPRRAVGSFGRPGDGFSIESRRTAARLPAARVQHASDRIANAVARARSKPISALRSAARWFFRGRGGRAATGHGGGSSRRLIEKPLGIGDTARSATVSAAGMERTAQQLGAIEAVFCFPMAVCRSWSIGSGPARAAGRRGCRGDGGGRPSG